MQPGGNTRSPPVPRLLLAATLLLGGNAACAGVGSGGEDSTVDRILHQLDETARQRTADARRIEDLSRRVAVLELLLQDERNRAAAARATEPPVPPPPGEPARSAAASEPPPPLPVVRLAPPGPGATTGNLALAQGTAARAAPDVVAVEEPAPREPADELSDIPYQGVGFGNDGGDGYLRIGAPDASTIRLVGAPRNAAAPAAPAAPTAPGGTPSAAFGPVPRIPPMVPTPPAGETVATPAASATGAYQAGIEAYRERRWQEAIGWFERALAQGLDGSKAALALFFQAEATFQTRAYVEAIGLFERFLDRHPGHARQAEALLRLGTASERLGDVERAADLYRRVVAEHPASPAAATAAARLEATGTEGRHP